ncbi:MAG: hypothetical protein EBZ40_11165 [Gammaproteobacteria bacterium]|nr:hypothetical protein [Gammaproteobacteria bacterium]
MEAATCKRRTALGVHYAMYAPQLVLNAIITGTSLVDVGMFDEATARRIIGFTGIAIACLQALSAGFGLHRRAAELSTYRQALVMLRNEFDLALTHEVTESERARLCALYASTMGMYGGKGTQEGSEGEEPRLRTYAAFGREEAHEAHGAHEAHEEEAHEVGHEEAHGGREAHEEDGREAHEEAHEAREAHGAHEVRVAMC